VPLSIETGDGLTARPLVPALVRAAKVLELLAREGPVSNRDLAHRTGLPKSTLSNLLTTLEDLRWVTRAATNELTLGPRLIALGLDYIGSRDPVVEFHAACDAIGEELPHTAQLAVLDRGWSVTYIARRRGRSSVMVASELGHPLPANCTGAGKALLSTLTAEQLRARAPADPLPQLTASSIDALADLERDLAATRERGWAIDDDETLVGVTCRARVVPPVPGTDQRFAVSVTLLKAHLDAEQEGIVGALVERLATDLGSRLGMRAQQREGLNG
jgi:IclR family transcriptional regulator, blcABC operon repressor